SKRDWSSDVCSSDLDYHNVLKKKLRRIERFLHERGFEARHSVDSRPVYERAWARRAGIGFIGKNCCLIIPGYGSHVFLTTVITKIGRASCRERGQTY